MMTGTNRFALLVTLAALASMLMPLGGCAGRQAGRGSLKTATVRPMSSDAELTYDYLLYRDRLQRLRDDASNHGQERMTAQQAGEVHAEAVTALDRVLAQDPSPELFVEKAGLFWNHPDGKGRSRAALTEGLQLFPDNRLLTVYLANAYVADDQLDDAIRVMNDYISRHPDDVEGLSQLGQMFMEADKDAEALDVLKKIPEADRGPDDYYAMGRVQGNLGMRKAAIANLKKAIELDPGYTEAEVELAYQYELSKDYVAAEAIYNAILDQNESFSEVRLQLISLNLKLNNPSQALALTMDGPPSRAFVQDAVLMFISNGFYAQGSTALDRLLTGGSVPAEYYFYKAVIAQEGENDAAKAMEYLDLVSERDRLYPHALKFKAQLLAAEDKFDEALDVAAKGRERFPQASIFYIQEAAILKQQNDLEGAERSLLLGLSQLKNDPELTYELAMIYEVMGRRDEGLALMEQVIRVHPDHANSLNYVGYTLAEEGRELDRAQVLVTKASSLDPENGYILDSVAWVHFKKNELKKAWEYIRYAVDTVDKDPVIWEHYGDIAAAVGETASARKGYRKSLKLKHPDPAAIKAKLNTL